MAASILCLRAEGRSPLWAWPQSRAAAHSAGPLLRDTQYWMLPLARCGWPGPTGWEDGKIPNHSKTTLADETFQVPFSHTTLQQLPKFILKQVLATFSLTNICGVAEKFSERQWQVPVTEMPWLLWRNLPLSSPGFTGHFQTWLSICCPAAEMQVESLKAFCVIMSATHKQNLISRKACYTDETPEFTVLQSSQKEQSLSQPAVI